MSDTVPGLWYFAQALLLSTMWCRTCSSSINEAQQEDEEGNDIQKNPPGWLNWGLVGGEGGGGEKRKYLGFGMYHRYGRLLM